VRSFVVGRVQGRSHSGTLHAECTREAQRPPPHPPPPALAASPAARAAPLVSLHQPHPHSHPSSGGGGGGGSFTRGRGRARAAADGHLGGRDGAGWAEGGREGGMQTERDSREAGRLPRATTAGSAARVRPWWHASHCCKRRGERVWDRGADDPSSPTTPTAPPSRSASPLPEEDDAY
jgi:hypothetical protein